MGDSLSGSLNTKTKPEPNHSSFQSWEIEIRLLPRLGKAFMVQNIIDADDSKKMCSSFPMIPMGIFQEGPILYFMFPKAGSLVLRFSESVWFVHEAMK